MQETASAGHADTAAQEQAPRSAKSWTLMVEPPVVETTEVDPPRDPSAPSDVPMEDEDEDPVLGEGLIELTVPITRSTL